MSARRVLVGVVLTVVAVAQAAGQSVTKKTEQWEGGPKVLKGTYQVYGGELGEMVPPTAKDRKITFLFKGALAKELFGQIGPDIKDPCGTAESYRERRRGHMFCNYTKGEGHSCYFGIDVPTGKGIPGAIC